MPGLVLPTLFCPPAAYYAEILANGGAVIDTAPRFDKRCKQAHRCMIADTQGPLALTVPVAKPYGRTWADTHISAHGRWWEVMREALSSAYGRTPYFEFLIDDFLPMLVEPDLTLTVAELNCRMDSAIRRGMGLTVPVEYQPLGTSAPWTPSCEVKAYWQVRADRFGFIPDLSALDLLFNLGPESVAVLG